MRALDVDVPEAGRPQPIDDQPYLAPGAHRSRRPRADLDLRAEIAERPCGVEAGRGARIRLAAALAATADGQKRDRHQGDAWAPRGGASPSVTAV